MVRSSFERALSRLGRVQEQFWQSQLLTGDLSILSSAMTSPFKELVLDSCQAWLQGATCKHCPEFSAVRVSVGCQCLDCAEAGPLSNASIQPTSCVSLLGMYIRALRPAILLNATLEQCIPSASSDVLCRGLGYRNAVPSPTQRHRHLRL